MRLYGFKKKDRPPFTCGMTEGLNGGGGGGYGVHYSLKI